MGAFGFVQQISQIGETQRNPPAKSPNRQPFRNAEPKTPDLPKPPTFWPRPRPTLRWKKKTSTTWKAHRDSMKLKLRNTKKWGPKLFQPKAVSKKDWWDNCTFTYIFFRFWKTKLFKAKQKNCKCCVEFLHKYVVAGCISKRIHRMLEYLPLLHRWFWW